MPEFDDETQKIIVTNKYEKPPYFDTYLSMDIGGKDFTVVLFAYYDFLKNTVVIEDEYVLRDKQNSQTIAQNIKEKCNNLWGEKLVYLSFSDNNNPILINDLQLQHGMNFIPSRKDNKEAAINQVRLKIMNHQILIHPRCATLIYHLQYATWAKKSEKAAASSGYKQFARSADYGHFDAVDALIYLIRNVVYSKNPYPAGYDLISSNTHYKRNPDKTEFDAFKKMFTVRKSLKS